MRCFRLCCLDAPCFYVEFARSRKACASLRWLKLPFKYSNSWTGLASQLRFPVVSWSSNAIALKWLAWTGRILFRISCATRTDRLPFDSPCVPHCYLRSRYSVSPPKHAMPGNVAMKRVRKTIAHIHERRSWIRHTGGPIGRKCGVSIDVLQASSISLRL